MSTSILKNHHQEQAVNSQEKSDYLFALLAGATVREQVYKDKTSLSLIKQTVKMIA